MDPETREVESSTLLISVNSCNKPYPVYPLGIGYLTASLQAAGIRVEVFDMNLDSNGLEAAVRRAHPRHIGLSIRNIDDIRIQDTAFYAPAVREVVRRIRSVTDVPIIIGGSGYSLFPERLLALCEIEYGMCGEGEHALPRLLHRLEDRGPVEEIPGLVYRIDGRIIRNPPQSCDLNATPPPVRQNDLVGYYLGHSSMLNIQTQRGCSFRCCYCTYPLIEGRTVRRREAGAVCDEIESLVEAGARYFFIVDSVFNTSEAHVEGICEEIVRRGLRIEWGCFMRPKGIGPALIAHMARAGLKHIEFGSDSFCDPVLEAYGKEFTFDDILRASECAREAGVRYAHFLIFGGPAETEATMRTSYANSRFIKRSVFFPFIGMRVYPHTPLHEHAVREGVIGAERDLLEPCFYITPFLSRERITELCTEFNREAHNWILGDPDPQHLRVMSGLRGKGVAGPLWEFLIR